MSRTAVVRAVVAAALMVPFGLESASAQDYRGAWGVYGGGIWFSDLNSTSTLDEENGEFTFEGTEFSRTDLSLEPGWLAGTQLEYWFGSGRFGVRLNGAYTEQSFELDADDGGEAFEETSLFATRFGRDFETGAVNTWLGDIDLMIRFAAPERDRVWAPFLSVGAGVAHYDPAGDAGFVFPSANARFGFDGTDDDGVDDGDGNAETQFAGVVGIGTDFLPGWRLGGMSLGLRLELADHIAFDSPADPILAMETDPFFEEDEESDFDAVHNVRLTLGVHTLWGRLFEAEEVAALPAPPPPAVAPVEEAVSVCLIDPATSPEGVGVVSALYLPARGDTVVTIDGQRVAVADATADVAVLGDFDWYRTGQPLVLDADGERIEFATFGETRIVERDLVFLGFVDGLPVYAAATDVAEVRDDLERHGRDRDLDDLLDDETLSDDLREIEVLYAPMDPVGCVFQPLTRLQEVRKVRG